jgi:hypothetical protein
VIVNKANLIDGWRWVNAGETTDPKRDYHVWPRGSGKDLVSITSDFLVKESHEGMIVRNLGQPFVFTTQPDIVKR